MTCGLHHSTTSLLSFYVHKFSLSFSVSSKLFPLALFVLNFTSPVFPKAFSSLISCPSNISPHYHCLSRHLIPFTLLVWGLKWWQSDLTMGLMGRFTAKSPTQAFSFAPREIASQIPPLQWICFYCLQGHLSLIQLLSLFLCGISHLW